MLESPPARLCRFIADERETSRTLASFVEKNRMRNRKMIFLSYVAGGCGAEITR